MENMDLPITEYQPKKEYDDDLMDRISELPEELLGCILSWLTLKEAARTSVLSRGWEHLWLLFTGSLNFDATNTLRNTRLRPKKLQKERDRYVEVVNRVLNTRQSPIDELRVCFDLTEQYRLDIDRWIEVALTKKVERLELDLTPCVWSKRMSYVFTRKFCVSSEIKLLTCLCLKHVEVSGEILEYFLSNCPLLETLHVSYSKQITNLNVSGSSLRLKHLNISCCYSMTSLEIYAPNLVSFEFRSGCEIPLHLRYVPQLVNLSYGLEWDMEDFFFYVFPSCLAICVSQLVNLSVQFICLTEIEQCPELPNLRYLTCEVSLFSHRTARSLLDLLSPLIKACPLLHKLKVELVDLKAPTLEKQGEVEKANEEVEKIIKYNVSHKMLLLREVEIVGFVGAPSDTRLLIYLLKKAKRLEKIVIDPCPVNAEVDIQTKRKHQEAREFGYQLLKNRPNGAELLVL